MQRERGFPEPRPGRWRRGCDDDPGVSGITGCRNPPPRLALWRARRTTRTGGPRWVAPVPLRWNYRRKDCELTYRCAIRLAIEGDLRFLSHHDMMRAMERIVTRAKLPLRYSQGFNPRPAVSLSCPRPVGVASHDDRLVLVLEEELCADDLCRRLNEQAPRGMRFLAAAPLESKSLQPLRIDCQLPLEEPQSQAATRRMEELETRETWSVERPGKPGRPRRGRPAAEPRPRPMDLRPLVERMEIRDGVLRFSLVARNETWAKPSEVLQLLGLAEPELVSRLVRTHIET